MSVLVCLAEHHGDPVSKDQLLKAVWPDTFVGEGVLTRSISELRRVLEDEAKDPRIIQTIAKRGYRLMLPVMPVDGPATKVTAHSVAFQERNPVPALKGGRRFVLPGFLGTALVFGLLFLSDMTGLKTRLLGSEPSIHSVAVLPLQNLSGDPGQEYFAEAMTEELITELSRVSALNVVSRTSVMPYKDSKKSLPEIARELHADAIVEGSVVRSGDRVRITAQLIHASKDTNIWAQTYDRDVQDVLTLQSAVASAIAEEIRVKVKPEESARWKAVRPVNRQALESYVIGRDHMDRAAALEFHSGKEQAYQREIGKAVESFRTSVQQDPGYVPAYLGIFDVVNSAGVVSHEDLLPAAREGIRKALELDDTLVEAHLDMARLLMQWDYDYEAAGKEYRRALELAPNSADVHVAYSDYLGAYGSHEDVDKELEIAQELDPTHNRYMNGFPMNWTLDRDRQSLDEGKDDPSFRAALGKGYQTRGRYREAVEQYIKACELYGYKNEVAILRRHYRKGDYKGAIRAWMTEWESRAKREYVPPFWPAFLYANLADNDAAFRWLEKAYREHSWCMLGLNDDLIWNPIRSDPRFAKYVHLAGLPEDHGQFVTLREELVPR